MFRLLPHLVAALLIALTLPAAAQDKDKAEKDKVEKDKPGKDLPKPVDPPKPPENKFVSAGVLNGELAHVETGKQVIRVKISIQYQDGNELNAAAQQQRNAQAALARGDRNAAASHFNSMRQHLAQSVKTKTEEVSVEAAENVQVRLNAPKPGFDEMGNIKKYTPKELASLKGKDGKYDGEFSDLMPGQLVSVQMVRPRNAPKVVKPDELGLDDNKPKASVILIVAQPRAQ